MAITNVSAPSLLYNLAADPFVFEFSMSPVGSATEVRRFGYQLCDDSDEPISGKELITVKDGETFAINFQNDIRPAVYTKPPSVLSNVIAQDEMVRTLRLKVFEHVFNKDTCAVSIENEATVGDYVVINGANQYWGLQTLGSGGWLWLNPMAGYIKMCRDRSQLIYLWSDSSVNIVISGRSSVTGSDYSVVRSNTGANSYTIDPSEIAALMVGTEGADTGETLPKIAYITVEVDGTELVKFELDNCCDVHRIAWQHSGGGYSFMRFDGGREVSAQMSGNEVYRYQDPTLTYTPTLAASREKGGMSIGSRETLEQVSLKTTIDIRSERDIRWMQDFLASGSYYYEFAPFTGSYDPATPVYQYVKFIPNFATVKHYEAEELIEITFTGKIARKHNMPNYEI